MPESPTAEVVHEAAVVIAGLAAESDVGRKVCSGWSNRPPGSTVLDPFNKYKTCCVHRVGKSGHGIGACLVMSKPDNSGATPLPDYQGNYSPVPGGPPPIG